PPPRRAGGRPQPRGGLGARRVHQEDPRRLRAHGAARRAPHEPRDGDLRPGERHELRAEDLRRLAGGGARRSGRDRGVSRSRGRARVKTLLELDGVAARYGPVQALYDVSLVVREGEVVAVLGANGAGKTTTLRAISGTVSRSGVIELEGKQL